MRRAAIVLVAVAALGFSIPAGAASGDPQGRIDSATADAPGQLDVAFSAVQGTATVPLKPGSLTASIEGGPTLTQLSTGSATNGTRGATTGPRPSVVLALDTSGSMVDERHGIDRMKPMKAAAKRFVDALPQVDIGLVTFGDPAVVQAPVGTPHDELDRKIDALAPGGDTALFSAAAQAGQLLQQVSGSRQVLMLTDGKNDPAHTHDHTTAAAAGRLLGQHPNSPIRFSSLLIQSGSPDPHLILANLEKKVGRRDLGTVGQAKDTNLQPILAQTFDITRQGIEQQQSGTFAVPANLAGTAPNVVVKATTEEGHTVSATQLVPFRKAAPHVTSPPAPAPAHPVGRTVVVLGLLALFAALATLLAVVTGAIAGRSDPESQVLRRLEVYSVGGARPEPVTVREQVATTRLGDSVFTRSAVNLMSRVARRSRLDSALDGRLEAAGLPLRTAEWMLLHVGAAVGGGVLLLVLGGGRLAPTLLGLVLGLTGPWVFLLLSRTRRRTRFLGQLPDTLQLLAGSLAAGYSLPQAMDAVVREAAAPIKDEFNRALIEARLGMLPEDALDGIARRTDSEDFSWIVLAIRIQRDVGGNLAELLTTVAGTLRDRERLRRQVSALSAEGKLSGVILGALPVVFGGYLMLTRPDYMSPLFGTPLGLGLLVTGVVLLVVGGIWMAKMIQVDV